MSKKAKCLNRMEQGGNYHIDSNGSVHVLMTVSNDPDNPGFEETTVHEYNIYTRSNNYPSVARPLTRVNN